MGNGDFTVLGAGFGCECVTGGSGTPADPYIISDWEIDASFATGIMVFDTNAPFVVRDVFVHSGRTGGFDGISLFNVTDARVHNATLQDNVYGVSAFLSRNVTVTSSNLSGNDNGFAPIFSENITVIGNTVSQNAAAGGAGIFSINITAEGNNFSDNDFGLLLGFAVNAVVTNNTFARNTNGSVAGILVDDVDLRGNNVSDSFAGIALFFANNVTAIGNNISNNFLGFSLGGSTNATLQANFFVSDGVILAGFELAHYNSHTITTDNLVNGKPLYYHKDCSGLNVTGIAAGQLLVANCTSVQARNLSIADADVALQLAYVDNALLARNDISFNDNAGIIVTNSTRVAIARNNVTANSFGVMVVSTADGVLYRNQVSGSGWYGIALNGSTDVALVRNTVALNSYGIGLNASAGISVVRNNLVGNGVQATDDRGVENTWDGGFPRGGNYWSDYAGVDACTGPLQNVCPSPDGLGDSPRVIDTNTSDRYPLMAAVVGPEPPEVIAAELTGVAAGDLTLTWIPSPDEAYPEGVAAYRVLRAVNDVAGPYAEIATVPSDGSPGYVFVCSGCGHNPLDANHTFFRIQAVDTDGGNADSNLAAKYAKAVGGGRALLTVPVQAAEPSLTVVLQTVWTDLVGAWAYDALDAVDPWKSYGAAKGGGDLAALPFGSAFWVETSAAGVYTVAGLVVEQPSVVLQPGWNLVAYGATTQETRDVSLAGLAGVTRVQTFDGAGPYHTRSVAGGEFLLWGEAYWVSTTGTGLWLQG